jgi:DNA-binding MarR family transcriptional regulator
MSALTSGLERQGLVERTTAEADGRGVFFNPTKKGLETFSRAERLLAERFNDVLGDARGTLKALDTSSIEAALDAQVDRDFGTPP